MSGNLTLIDRTIFSHWTYPRPQGEEHGTHCWSSLRDRAKVQGSLTDSTALTNTIGLIAPNRTFSQSLNNGTEFPSTDGLNW